MGLSQFDEKDAYTHGTVVSSSGYSPAYSLLGALTRPVRIDQILIVSDDIIDQSVRLHVHINTGGDAYLGTTNVVAGAGMTPAVKPADFFPDLLPTISGLNLSPYDDLELYLDIGLTATHSMWFLFLGGYL